MLTVFTKALENLILFLEQENACLQIYDLKPVHEKFEEKQRIWDVYFDSFRIIEHQLTPHQTTTLRPYLKNLHALMMENARLIEKTTQSFERIIEKYSQKAMASTGNQCQAYTVKGRLHNSYDASRMMSARPQALTLMTRL